MPKVLQKQRNLLYMRDILNAITKIESYIGNMTYEKFEKDEKTQDAIIRNLEIIGEAIKSIPTELRMKNPTIPWKSYTGIRDIMIHHYFKIDLKAIWDTILNDLPQLKEAVQNLLEDPSFLRTEN